MEKKNYIAPAVSVFDLGLEALLQGGINVKSGENHGGFGAKQQEVVIEDDYYNDDFEDESANATSAIGYRPYTLWDDDL